jgi:hypothetical protein
LLSNRNHSDSHLEIEWQSPNRKVFLRKELLWGVNKLNYSIWISLNKILDNGDTITYQFAEASMVNRIIIENNIIYIFERGVDGVNNYYGWYRKGRDAEFLNIQQLDVVRPPNTNDSTYIVQRGILYGISTESGKMNKIFGLEDILNVDISSLGYNISGVFKYSNYNLIKISNDANDIMRLKDGLYYVPLPGTGIKHQYNLVDMASALDSVERLNDAPPCIYLATSTTNL